MFLAWCSFHFKVTINCNWTDFLCLLPKFLKLDLFDGKFYTAAVDVCEHVSGFLLFPLKSTYF